MSKSGEKDPDFPYTHLWVSANAVSELLVLLERIFTDGDACVAENID